jgi:hypothetical protein
VDFAEALDRYGFRPEQGDRGPLAFGSARLFVAHPNPFLTYHVHTYDDGTALFTWEFAIGEYLATKGIQFGSDETLNQFAYPRVDARGARDAVWLTAAVEQARALLADVRLDRPAGNQIRPEPE